MVRAWEVSPRVLRTPAAAVVCRLQLLLGAAADHPDEPLVCTNGELAPHWVERQGGVVEAE